MTILHLTLKKKWFDMILSGEKKEEYREIKSYWIKRLVNPPFSFMNNSISGLKHDLEACPNGFWRKYNVIIFKNGYSKNASEFTIEFKGVDFGKAKPEWSDNWKGEVFIIKLGKILNTNNN